MQTKSAPQVVTLRNMPPRLASRLRQKADADGLSLNKTVIKLLEQSLGLRELKTAKRIYDDLDDLIGSWSESEAAEFDEALREQRTIDEEMWK